MNKLPFFNPGKREQEWIDNERKTARIIQLLWRHGTQRDRRDPEFLKVLIRSAWANGGRDGSGAGRNWRNRHIAAWLGLDDGAAEEHIAGALAKKLRMPPKDAAWLVQTSSGITNYYKPFRTAFMEQVDRHTKSVTKAFALVSERRRDVEKKVLDVAALVFVLPKFNVPNRRMAPMMNGLAPVLASLDPQSRFPIMNDRTERLLSIIPAKADAQGALSLSRLIGRYGIEDSLCLDVYADSLGDNLKPARRSRVVRVPESKSVGIKAEEAGIAHYAKRKVIIRKRHNALINEFKRAVEWKHHLLQTEYDILIEDWKPGRRLLIEAKTETGGVGGRTQLRQAIGQLFDYRWRSFRQDTKNVDLALLTPTKPDGDILGLLTDLGIDALWFERGQLAGTISLD